MGKEIENPLPHDPRVHVAIERAKRAEAELAKKLNILPRTLEEAYARQPPPLFAGAPGEHGTRRTIPYAEYYRTRTGVIETPIQRLAALSRS